MLNKCIVVGIVFTFIITHIEPLYGVSEMFPSFLFGFIIRKYNLLKFNYMLILLLIYVINLIFWDYDYGEYDLFKIHKYLFDTKYSNYYGLLKELYRVITGISGAYVFFYFIRHISKKIPEIIQMKLAEIGQETLGIYLVQSLVLERFLRYTINFGFMDANIYNFLFSPILSLLLVYLCYYLVKLLERNWISKIIIYK